MRRQRRPPPGSRTPTKFPLAGSSCRRRSPEARACEAAWEAMWVGPDPGADEENPGLRDLFRHYDELYFGGALAGAAFSVEWVSPRTKTITSFGSCSFGDLHKITLYKPTLQYRTNADLKNALLHLMIHAIIFLKHGLTSPGHGPVFRDWMDAINTCPVDDHARPIGGYCITTTHDFSQEKSCNMQGFLWKCESCGRTLVRAKSLKPPSDSCCIENVSQHLTCGNILCHWHNHKMDCGGTYVLTKPPVTPQKMAPKGGSSSLKEAGNSNMPEDLQKAIVVSSAPLRRSNPKQELLAWAKREQLLTGGRDDATKSPGSSSLKKADDHSQKAIVLSAAPGTRRPKRKQTPVTSEEHGFLSPVSCNNANTPRSGASGNDVRRAPGVRPCASQKKLKPVQDLVASEQHISRPAATHSTPKQPARTGSSTKARRQWHQPEECPRIAVQPAAVPRSRSRSEVKRSSRAAAGSNARGRCAERKEYVCFSLWQNFYESECSSGSAEPLVNKRTLRRKRERERLVQQRAHSRSIDDEVMTEAPGGQSGPPAPSMDVHVDQVVTQAPGAAGGLCQSPAPSMDVVVPPADHRGRSDPSSSMDVAAAVAPADRVVMSQAPADQSRPPAPCSVAAGQVVPVPPRSADPPGLTPLNPSSWPDVIDISDDDDDD